MSIWEDAEDCPICGAEPPNYLDDASASESYASADAAQDAFWTAHEHSADVAVMRDGARGIDLLPTFAEDAYDILGTDVPNDVRDAIRTYRASYSLSGLDMPSDDALGNATDTLHDLAMYDLEGKLDDAGYVTSWDDGYVIYDVRAYRKVTVTWKDDA